MKVRVSRREHSADGQPPDGEFDSDRARSAPWIAMPRIARLRTHRKPASTSRAGRSSTATSPRFLLVLLLAAGTVSPLASGQKEDPDFTFRIMVVQVLWPGASVQEMQDQVVDKIERKLQETPHLDLCAVLYAPRQRQSSSSILKARPAAERCSDAFYQVRKKIGDIQNTFRHGVLGPFFNDEFGDTYLALYAISGDGFTYPELRDFAKNARDSLLRVPGVGKVDLLGVQDEKVYIEIPSRVLAERGISVQDIQAALAGQNSQAPAGIAETDRSVRQAGRARQATDRRSDPRFKDQSGRPDNPRRRHRIR